MKQKRNTTDLEYQEFVEQIFEEAQGIPMAPIRTWGQQSEDKEMWALEEILDEIFAQSPRMSLDPNLGLTFQEWYRRLNDKIIRGITIIAKRKGVKEEEIEKYLNCNVPTIMMIYLEHYKRFTAMMKLTDHELSIKNCNERINFKQDPKMDEIEEIVGKYRAEEAILSRKLKESEYLNPILLRPIEGAIFDGRTSWDLITEMKRLENYCYLIPYWAWNPDWGEF